MNTLTSVRRGKLFRPFLSAPLTFLFFFSVLFLVIDQEVKAQVFDPTHAEIGRFFDSIENRTLYNTFEACVLNTLENSGYDPIEFRSFDMKQFRGRLPSGFFLLTVSPALREPGTKPSDPNFLIKTGTNAHTIGLMMQQHKSLALQNLLDETLGDELWRFFNPKEIVSCQYLHPERENPFTMAVSLRTFINGFPFLYMFDQLRKDLAFESYIDRISDLGSTLGSIHFLSSNANPELLFPFNSRLFQSSKENPRGSELYHAFPSQSPGYTNKVAQVWTESMVHKVLDQSVKQAKSEDTKMIEIDREKLLVSFNQAREAALSPSSFQPYVTLIHGLPDLINAHNVVQGYIMFREPWRMGMLMDDLDPYAYFGSPEIDYFVVLEDLEFQVARFGFEDEDIEAFLDAFRVSYCAAFHKKISIDVEAILDSLGPDTHDDHDSLRLRLSQMKESHSQCSFHVPEWSEFCHWIARLSLLQENPKMTEWLFLDFV